MFKESLHYERAGGVKAVMLGRNARLRRKRASEKIYPDPDKLENLLVLSYFS